MKNKSILTAAVKISLIVATLFLAMTLLPLSIAAIDYDIVLSAFYITAIYLLRQVFPEKFLIIFFLGLYFSMRNPRLLTFSTLSSLILFVFSKIHTLTSPISHDLLNNTQNLIIYLAQSTPFLLLCISALLKSLKKPSGFSVLLWVYSCFHIAGNSFLVYYTLNKDILISPSDLLSWTPGMLMLVFLFLYFLSSYLFLILLSISHSKGQKLAESPSTEIKNSNNGKLHTAISLVLIISLSLSINTLLKDFLTLIHFASLNINSLDNTIYLVRLVSALIHSYFPIPTSHFATLLIFSCIYLYRRGKPIFLKICCILFPIVLLMYSSNNIWIIIRNESGYRPSFFIPALAIILISFTSLTFFLCTATFFGGRKKLMLSAAWTFTATAFALDIAKFYLIPDGLFIVRGPLFFENFANILVLTLSLALFSLSLKEGLPPRIPSQGEESSIITPEEA